MKTYVIGDIHGCLTSLKTVLENTPITAQDRLIFVGDYIDRGPDSKGVIDYLLKVQQEYSCEFLMGNHEEKFLLSRVYDFEIKEWYGFWDAQATMDSYGTDDIEQIPESHWEFLRKLCLFIEDERFIYVHATLEPDVELQRQQSHTLIHQKLKDPQPHCSGKIVICGHTAQKNHLPLDKGHTLCIDTDAGRDGWVTCLCTNTGTYWQANEQAEYRQGVISSLSREHNQCETVSNET